jgi:Tfp pilus assembly protein FimT
MRGRCAGFTIFETLIAMGVMLVMTTIALPRLVNATEEYRLTSVAREVSGQLANARIRAITGNADYRISVTGDDTYELQESVAGTWTTRESYEMPPGFLIGANGAAIAFHRRGNATPVATLSVTNRNGTVAQVVTATSGRSYVQ